MTQASPSTKFSQVERDPRLFFWFLTLIMLIVYGISLSAQPALRAPLNLTIYTALFAVHVFLHWQSERIVENPKLSLLYCLLQGTLGFIISQIAAQEAVTFAIYMALFGETVGMFGLSLRTLLLSLFYLALAFLNIQQTLTTLPPALLALTALPAAIFVVFYVTLYRRQTEAREQAQALARELEAANRQLSEYAIRVEDLTLAAERERMARELHDTLSQGLAGLTLQLEAADAHLGQERPEKARQIITQAMQKARETLADSRRVIGELREFHLGELEDSLRREAHRFEAATGLPCRFHADQTPPLPDPVKETLIRAASEGLTNIARHAQASQAAVTLSVKDQTLELEIKDNGRGFDPEAIPTGHYGLLGLSERARLCHGTLDILSAPGRGATLTLRLPHPTPDTSHLTPHDPHPDR